VYLLAFLIDGLLIGFVYGIAAMGMTLIWGVMNVINLAHGSIIALGCFGVYLLVTQLGVHPYLALLIVAPGGLLFGVLFYRVAIQRIIDAPRLSSLLATFAVNMILIGLGTAVFSTTPRALDVTLGSLSFGPITILGTRLAAALASIATAAGLYLFLYRTRPGKYVRAVTNNRAAAELVGIPSQRVLALSFGLGCMLAAVSGALIATFFPFNILSGDIYQQKSFVIGVLGGLGHPLGALVGGLILGTMEGLLPAFVPTTWVPVFEFVLFVIILLARPTGLFGEKK
jgi:branched-subunit amino acid ABC-type transport system permease component